MIPDSGAGSAKSGSSSSKTGSSGTSAGATSGAGGQRGRSARASTRTGGVSLGLADNDQWSQWWDSHRDLYFYAAGASRRGTVSAGTGALSGRGRQTAGNSRRRTFAAARLTDALLELLGQEDEAPVLAAAAVALGSSVPATRAEDVVAGLRGLLQHDDRAVRSAAALGLGLTGSPTAAPPLAALVRCDDAGHALVGGGHVDPAVRAAAAVGLGLLGEPSSVPALLDAADRLPDSLAAVKSASLDALGDVGALDSGVVSVFLKERLADRSLDARIKAMVPGALARLGDATAVGALLTTLADRDSDRLVRQSCVQALGNIAAVQQTRVLDALEHIVEEGRDAPTRHFALLALAEIGGRDGDAQPGAAAHERLVRLFTAQLRKPRTSADRPWVGLAAGVYGHGCPAAANELEPALSDAYADVADPAQKGAFALGLGLLGAQAAADDLVEDHAAVKDAGFRSQIAQALGLLGHRASADIMLAELQRKGADHGTTSSVARAARLVADATVRQAVVDRFRNARTTHHRVALAEALGAWRAEEVATDLMDVALDESMDTATRAAAVDAAGRVLSREALPWQVDVTAGRNYVADSGARLAMARRPTAMSDPP